MKKQKYNEKDLEIKFDKAKAKRWFVLLKFLEVFGVFLLTIGFYGLGSLVMKYPKLMDFYDLFIPTTYLETWFLGFVLFFIIFLQLSMLGAILWIIYEAIKGWIKSNWKLSRLMSENIDTKAKRLKAKESKKMLSKIEGLKEQRKKWGYCEGDEVILKDHLEHEKKYGVVYFYDSMKFKGKEKIITLYDNNGTFYITGGIFAKSYTKEMIKKVIKMELPK